MVEIIKNLCNLNMMSLNDLEDMLEFGSNTITRWDKTNPSVRKVQKVADFFHVSMDYILEREIDSKRAVFLSDDETELLTAYRKLNDEGKHRILGDSVSFATDTRYKKDKHGLETA